MNALFLNRIASYRQSPQALATSRNIILHKIARQNALLKKYSQPVFVGTISQASLEHLLLFEARAAKHFWKHFAALLPSVYLFSGRRQRGKDIPNRLLDIGYHHLTFKVKKLIEAQGLPTEIGILHTAHRATSSPLAYDLVELFRSDIVDTEVLTFLRLKKKPLQQLTPHDIRIFLARVNKRMDKKVYVKAFRQCHIYTYCITLQILRCVFAINHREVFCPLRFPDRHEHRCP